MQLFPCSATLFKQIANSKSTSSNVEKQKKKENSITTRFKVSKCEINNIILDKETATGGKTIIKS
jgi:hypothetical protein